jgi:carbonic anhydrase/acetyltransferase-like protein (isoleucine patch superfamily)
LFHENTTHRPKVSQSLFPITSVSGNAALEYVSYELGKNVYVSENAMVIGDVTLGDEVNIWFGAVIRGDMHYIKIGNRTNIQDNSVVHVTTRVSPTNIGSGVTVGHSAIIHVA